MKLSEIDPDRLDRAIPRTRNGLRNCPGIDGCRRDGFLSLFRLDTHLRQAHSTNVEEFLEAFERRSPPRMPAAAPSQGREGRPHVVKPRARLEDLEFEASEEPLDLDPEDHDAEAAPQGVSGAEPSKRPDETTLEYVRRLLPYLRSRSPEIDWRVCEEPDCPAPGPIRGPRGLGGHRSKYHPRPRVAPPTLDPGALERVGARLREKEETMPGNEPQVGAPNGRSATDEVGLDDATKRRLRALEREAAQAISLPQMEVLEARMLPPFDRMLERYFEVLLEKAFAADEPDDALLDRIEALLLPAPAEIEVGEPDGR